MKNIPHKKPINFIKKFKYKDENKLVASADFPCKPTLTMFCEAAAQISASLNTSLVEGYLVSMSNLELFRDYHENDVFMITVLKEIVNGKYKEFSFEAKNKEDVLFAKGNFLILEK